MKKIMPIMFVAALFSPTAMAEEDDGFFAGIEADVFVPVGDWGANVGLGGMVKVGYTWSGTTFFGLRAGYIHHLPEEYSSYSDTNLSFYEAPVLLDLKYRFDFGLVLECAMGMVINGIQLGGARDDDLEFGLLVGMGYSISGVNLGFSYFATQLSEDADIGGLLFTLGYEFKP